MKRADAKHTPGPWSADAYSEKVSCGKYAEGTQVHICNVFDPIPSGPQGGGVFTKAEFKNEREANARLIACAPELLEMLRLIQADGYGSKALDALITKATGGAE